LAAQPVGDGALVGDDDDEQPEVGECAHSGDRSVHEENVLAAMKVADLLDQDAVTIEEDRCSRSSGQPRFPFMYLFPISTAAARKDARPSGTPMSSKYPSYRHTATGAPEAINPGSTSRSNEQARPAGMSSSTCRSSRYT